MEFLYIVQECDLGYGVIYDEENVMRERML
jgi:hypothetical protein